MDDPNFDFLKSKFRISKEAYEILTSLASYKKIKQGEILVEQGSISNHIFFLSYGLIRSYHILESGKEITKNLYTTYSFVGPFSSILKNEPSLLTHEALTDSILYEINFNDFIQHTKTNIEISNLYSRILEYLFILYERKHLDHISLNATKRYQILKEQIPNIDSIIPQYQIASYLNITAVQLSRIKKYLPD
ncbi:Crp/Fnr family transcriptional regulator [Winogradskyella sp.]|uniref:Crp/Fnr family transcriptional regulator n=1 Tax=Winogradskyella sp. TaxID=1883156 RepID=UPI0026244E6E|nr:Crp/Fnr family transcriptional regulator [Winogradskyella sp.]